MSFNINAQVILSAPKNLNAIGRQIQSTLQKAGTVNIGVKINANDFRKIDSLDRKIQSLTKSFTGLNSAIQITTGSISRLTTTISRNNTLLGNFSSQQNAINNQTNNANKSLQTQTGLLDNLGRRFSSTAKTAIAFGLISRPIYDLQRAFTAAVRDAIVFEKELVRLSQVTGESDNAIDELADKINKLAVTLGVNANKLADTATIIAQTGRSAADVQPILEALARSTLAPTFGDITETTEGLIAALGQFDLKASESEAILGSLNQVSKEFAVESDDLISAIRRSGGVFAQAAGDTKGTVAALQELSAIFTAVRSTTRESSETIATGLRTIFSRIQRRSTIDFLKQFNIDLVDTQDRFIGLFPAFDKISQKLKVLVEQGDALTLSAIAEELGGIRQIGKLLPAITQFEKAREALDAAQRGAQLGLDEDVAKGLGSIDNRIQRVKESFGELIRTLFQSDTFSNALKGLLSTTETTLQTITKIVDTLEPILPLLTSLGSLKLGKFLAGSLPNLLGGIGIGGSAKQQQSNNTNAANVAIQNTAATTSNTQALNNINATLTKVSTQLANIFNLLHADFNRLNSQVGTLIVTLSRRPLTTKVPGFARGGYVPGTGNSDSVPAMLMPGEFVIKKSSAQKLGAGTLQAMNQNKFAAGGIAKEQELGVVSADTFDAINDKVAIDRTAIIKSDRLEGKKRAAGAIGKAIQARFDERRTLLRQAGAIKSKSNLSENEVGSVAKDLLSDFPKEYKAKIEGINTDLEAPFKQAIDKGIGDTIQGGIDAIAQKISAKNPPRVSDITSPEFYQNFDNGSKGLFFENTISAFGGQPLISEDLQRPFDFTSGLGGELNKVYNETKAKYVDAKISKKAAADYKNFLPTKGAAQAAEEIKFSDIDKATDDFLRKTYGKGQPVGFASGGSVGTDTVPALLTPGEFVINKGAASQIGYGNLNRMNKTGVAGFNKGGPVGYYNDGGKATLKTNQQNQNQEGNGLRDFSGSVFAATYALSSFTTAIEDGRISGEEFFNLVLLASPGLVQLAAQSKNISESFKKFSQDLRGPKKVNGVPLLEPPGTAERRRSARSRFRNTSLSAVGVAASLLSSSFDENSKTGAFLSGAGAGVAGGSLVGGPIGAVIGGLVGGLQSLESSIKQEQFKKASDALAAVLKTSEDSVVKLEEALRDNTSTLSLVTNNIKSQGELTDVGAGKIKQDFLKASTFFGDESDSGALSRLSEAFTASFNVAVDTISTGSLTEARNRLATTAANTGLQEASGSLNQLGDQQTRNIAATLVAKDLNLIGDDFSAFGEAITNSRVSNEEYVTLMESMSDVVKGLVPEYKSQIDGLRATGKITEEQASIASRALALIAQDGMFAKTASGQSVTELLELEFGSVIDTADLLDRAFKEVQSSVFDLNIQTLQLSKNIETFGIAINQLNKDIAFGFTKFDNQLKNSSNILSGQFNTQASVNPFASITSASNDEILNGLDTLSSKFSVSLSEEQKSLIFFSSRQTEILKQMAVNLKNSMSTEDALTSAFESVSGLSSNALFNSRDFQAILSNITSTSREGQDDASPLVKLEKILSEGQFVELSTELSNTVKGLSDLYEVSNGVNERLNEYNNQLINIINRETDARLRSIDRLESFTPFSNKNNVDRTNTTIATKLFTILRSSTFDQASAFANDPTALLNERDSLIGRLRDPLLSAEDRTQFATELNENTRALTLLKDDTSRLAAIQQELAKIESSRLQQRQELSRLSVDENAQSDFFKTFRGLNQILTGREVSRSQADALARLSREDLAITIRSQDPRLNEEQSLNLAERVQRNIAEAQANDILRQRGMNPADPESQAFLRRFTLARTGMGETTREAKLEVSGRAIINAQNQIDLELATENIQATIDSLEGSFKELNNAINNAILRFNELNNTNQNNNRQNQVSSVLPTRIDANGTYNVNVNIADTLAANSVINRGITDAVLEETARQLQRRVNADGSLVDPSLSVFA